MRRFYEEQMKTFHDRFKVKATDELSELRQNLNYNPPFIIVKYSQTTTEFLNAVFDNLPCWATTFLWIGRHSTHDAGQGVGPVDALDEALRKGLRKFYPGIIKEVKLVDYHVMTEQNSNCGLDGHKTGTEVSVRVIGVFSDGKIEWGITAKSDNIIRASVEVLRDGYEWYLVKKLK